MDEVAIISMKRLLFWCPGCDEPHQITLEKEKPGGPVWGWNGSLVKPTLDPSIKVTYYVGQKEKGVCHSFVRDGQIQFLGDCTHGMAGKTVALEPFEIQCVGGRR